MARIVQGGRDRAGIPGPLPSEDKMSSTYQDMAQWIGRRGTVRTGHGTMTCSVVIVDAKTAYGRPRVHVEPLHGSGGAWVDVETFTPAREGGRVSVEDVTAPRIGGGS